MGNCSDRLGHPCNRDDHCPLICRGDLVTGGQTRRLLIQEGLISIDSSTWATAKDVKCEVCQNKFAIKTGQRKGIPGIILHFRRSHPEIFYELYKQLEVRE